MYIHNFIRLRRSLAPLLINLRKALVVLVFLALLVCVLMGMSHIYFAFATLLTVILASAFIFFVFIPFSFNLCYHFCLYAMRICSQLLFSPLKCWYVYCWHNIRLLWVYICIYMYGACTYMYIHIYVYIFMGTYKSLKEFPGIRLLTNTTYTQLVNINIVFNYLASSYYFIVIFVLLPHTSFLLPSRFCGLLALCFCYLAFVVRKCWWLFLKQKLMLQ